ncbi:hypothetical protein CK203_092293 [Vitis vinifera]|uniref:Uncharacterized protein n=2 Tax=Vitis vinifera TaxID=29760 RepID=A0A438FJJ6_VITVI|nr:hypothetical protein CK203_092293 [Vitis vinifera]
MVYIFSLNGFSHFIILSGIMARLVINRVAWDSNSWPFLAVSRVTVHKKQSWKRCAAHMFT